jgi:hypothetical protein
MFSVVEVLVWACSMWVIWTLLESEESTATAQRAKERAHELTIEKTRLEHEMALVEAPLEHEMALEKARLEHELTVLRIAVDNEVLTDTFAALVTTIVQRNARKASPTGGEDEGGGDSLSSAALEGK